MRPVFAALLVATALALLAAAMSQIRVHHKRAVSPSPGQEPRHTLDLNEVAVVGRSMERYDGDLAVHVFLAGLIVFVSSLAYVLVLVAG